MNRHRIISVLLGLLVSAGLLCAQTANPKMPQPKSQKELDAIMAMFQAPDAQARIKAAMALITGFADTEFKSTAFYTAAFSAREIGDMENTIIYAEKAIEADKQNFGAMVVLASGLAQRTREFDLDKEEKLSRADKLAKEALDLIPKAVKPNPNITDEQWEAGKKDYMAQAYEALGLIASVRKDYPACSANFNLASQNTMQIDPALLVRLSSCLKQEKKYDEAIAALDKALADPNAHPQVKQVATLEKMEINKLKAAAAK